MAYFDNAATTYPKPECVYEFMDRFYRESGGNAGRGQYETAMRAGKLIGETRGRVQNLLHCPAKQVVFEPSATIALNIILQGLIEFGAANIYISPFEHNAVTRTLHHFEEKGKVRVYQLDVTEDLQYDFERIRCHFEEVKPDLVVVSHASNVMGLVSPVEEIFLLAKKYGAYTVVDMAQTCGLVDLNAGLETIDFAVFDGHKTMYGPTGIAGFVMKPDFRLPAVFFGGTGYESANQDMPDSLPQRFEFGTMNIAGIAGLYAALGWIQEQTVQAIWDKEQDHRKRLLEILGRYDFLKQKGVYRDRKYVGIVSCTMDGISSDTAGNIFSEQGISVRTGLQCAPLTHKFLGTYPAGTIRFSVSYFTDEMDFQELEQTLEYIQNNL